MIRYIGIYLSKPRQMALFGFDNYVLGLDRIFTKSYLFVFEVGPDGSVDVRINGRYHNHITNAEVWQYNHLPRNLHDGRKLLSTDTWPLTEEQIDFIKLKL